MFPSAKRAALQAECTISSGGSGTEEGGEMRQEAGAHRSLKGKPELNPTERLRERHKDINIRIIQPRGERAEISIPTP